MGASIKVELPIPNNSKFLSKYKSIGDLKSNYKGLLFVKYIYLDPEDNKLKGANPPDFLPLVPNAYLTIAGSIDDIIQFSSDLSTI